MNDYRHTQPGKFMVVAMAAAAALVLTLGLLVARPALAGVPILLICGWRFHSLTVEIADSELRWRFGPGLIRKKVPLADVLGVQAVRTTWMEGWGIHCGPHGWLYNVSGYDAVAVTLRDGRRFALGTDQPEALLNAFRQRGIPARNLAESL